MNNKKLSIRFLTSSISNQRGQSLVIALLVMFLLVFIAGLFVTMIARNVGRTARSGETINADYLADAGVHYADEQITYSPDGADWRPAPTYPKVVQSLNGVTVTFNPGDMPDVKDPDYKWLMQGFSRHIYGKGRFLLRVSYNPSSKDPMSKYLKIESIGRVGVVDERDPTTWQAQSERLRSEKIAYKAIGITDFARFITNKDRRGDELELGTPGYVTSFGEWLDLNNDGAVQPNEVEGAPIRANGDVVWHGRNYVYLNADRGDDVEVSGDIRHAVYSSVDPSPDGATYVSVNKYRTEESGSFDNATGSTLFSTIPLMRSDGSISDIGSYRDGRSEGDRNAPNPLPRNISRLDPPLVDSEGPAGGLGRYRDLTRNSGDWLQDIDGNWFNTGYYGWGEGIYIDNRYDTQPESSMFTLRGNWTQPGSQYWIGPYYTPPGISIQLTPYDLDNEDGDDNVMTGVPDMIVTHENGPGQPKYNWYDRNGNIVTSAGERMVMPYPKNGVIFAEGNIRIQGTLPPAPDQNENYSNQISVVSGGTIYIEGNILKYPYDAQGLPTKQKDSAIALLATDYVCVNTTQFFGPVKEVLSAGSGGKYFEVTTDKSFWISFAFGANSVDLVDGSGQAYFGSDLPVSLLVRHTSPADYGASFINLLINYPPTEQDKQNDPYASVYKFWNNNPVSPRDYIYGLGDPSANQKEPGWEYAVYPLEENNTRDHRGSYRFFSDPGVYNSIGFQIDQSVAQNMGMLDYYISRAAVQPCDIRIEALIYAQNGSFFVIPGEWFNPDPNDTREAYESMPAGQQQRPVGVNDEWPFFGEPLDVRVIVYGAVNENLPAPVGDSSDWMEKWGWIPMQHGSKDRWTAEYRLSLEPNDDTYFKRKGLTFIYDPILSNPKRTLSADPQQAIRKDDFGRPLPITPKLPVSTQLLYIGEPA
ncbi:MAG: hypothetical protein ACYC27_08745 [Armatimonadota bacterium]